MSISDYSTFGVQVERLPLDKTMPASGTHSLEPSVRGRGLRLSGSWSKALRTQLAMASASASASGVIVVDVDFGSVWTLRDAWWRELGGGRQARVQRSLGTFLVPEHRACHTRLQIPCHVTPSAPLRQPSAFHVLPCCLWRAASLSHHASLW